MLLNLSRRIAHRLQRMLAIRNRQGAVRNSAVSGLRGSIAGRTEGLVLAGWAARIGDPAPRKVEIRGPGGKLTLLADTYRKDLADAGINAGGHAFRIAIPRSWASKSPVAITLHDHLTGVALQSKRVQIDALERSYTNFDGFLQSSMTQPMVSAPFTDADRCSFAVMENIANLLVRETEALPDPPLVSVIMPVFDRADIVAKSILSVLQQSYRNLELIVVDDASTDATVDVVETFDDPRLRLITNDQNLGASAARTCGLAASKGALIAYLDSDNTWDDRFLAATVGALTRLSDADAVYSGMYLYRGKAEVLSAVLYGHFNQSLLEMQNYIDLNTFVHRRSLVEKAGYLDASVQRLDDYEYFLRATQGAKLFSVPVLLTHYNFDRADKTITKDHNITDSSTLVRERHGRAVAARLAQTRDILRSDVAVVIASWQALADLTACLESLLYQDWQGKLHVIVVDNASDDDVISYLCEKAAKGLITLIRNQKNYGFTYAVNQGIAAAPPQADILIANNDTVFQRGAVQALRDAAHELPDAAITAPRQMLRANTKTIVTHVPFANRRPKDADVDVTLSAHHRNIGPLPLFQGPGPVELTFAIFFCVLIRRDVIDALGPLDAEYGRHYRSDQTYCALVRSILGRKIYYVPDAVVFHGLQKSTEALRAHPELTRDFDLMYKKNQWDTDTRNELGFRVAPWDDPPE